MTTDKPTLRCPCDGRQLEATFTYDSRPEGETVYELRGQDYFRSISRCRACLHWFSNNELPLDDLYSGDYVAATYGGELHERFMRITGLPPEESDNAGRVAYISAFIRAKQNDEQKISVLDVGSGTGVFPFAIKQLGWDCVAIDPDPSAVEHLRSELEIDAVCTDFLSFDRDEVFDLITFNKVLEHVKDPVGMLQQSKLFLASGGCVYVEVPDAEMAATEGQQREEFFIEHLHGFSAASIALLANRAGFRLLQVHSVEEPSSKFTLRAFMSRD